MNVSKRFMEGLKKIDLTYDEIQTYKYAGGDQKSHLDYYKLIYKDIKLPDHKSSCICGHHIEENCYISNLKNDKIIVLGNCCIKRFVPKSKRTCDECGKEHRNSKINKCNDCKIKYCSKCFKFNGVKYKYCYDCRMR